MGKQFRILYRQFLFRLMDVELLSHSARGDASGLLGQCGALLIFGSVLQCLAAATLGERLREHAGPETFWQVERFLISLTMLTVGVFVLLSWDSTFLDRRDVLVLGPLPIRGRTLFAAKIAAAASALGLTVAAWNSFAGFAWPFVFNPPGAGFMGAARFAAAFWITLLAASAFLYCAVLGLQAVTAQLPRSWDLRTSSFLQIAVFMLFLGVVSFQPSFNSPAELGALENQRALAWLPSYWFLGLLSELSGTFAAEGHAVMAPLERRAVAGLAISTFLASGAFLLSYLRTLRKIVEEPDVVPGTRGGLWLPRFGSLPQTALTRFVIRTLLRSRQHRAIVAFYLGGGFAISVVYLGGAREMLHTSWAGLIERVNFPIMAASIIILCASWLGTRTVFSLPLDLRANWLFRITPAPGPLNCIAAVRRAMLAVAIGPVLAATAALLGWWWPWTRLLGHLLLLGLLGSILVDISLIHFRKIPFTCSYLPGKSKVHLVFWFGVIPVVIAIHNCAQLELDALPNPLRYAYLAFGTAGAAFAARRFANKSTDRSNPQAQFEEFASDELVGLGLNA